MVAYQILILNYIINNQEINQDLDDSFRRHRKTDNECQCADEQTLEAFLKIVLPLRVKMVNPLDDFLKKSCAIGVTY
jgi:hypothetical protein